MSLYDIIEALSRLLINSPHIFLTAAIVYVSGLYMISSYISSKKHKILKSLFGRLAFELVLFALLLIPIHLLVKGDLIISKETAKEIFSFVFVFVIATQTMIDVMVYYMSKKKSAKNGALNS